VSDQPRDWDKELAKIDKVIAKQGGAPAPEAQKGGAVARREATAAPAAARAPSPSRRGAAVAWFWTLLAAALAAVLPLWPYHKGCGLGLALFLGATGVAGLAGLLGAVASWSSRRGFAHILSLLALVWAGVIASREVLPRTGYAAETGTWRCESGPAQE